MHIEVDQSGKIGDTRVPTVLAFTDGFSKSIFIPAKVKRECVTFLRSRYRELRQPYMKLFAAALFLLLKDYIDEIDRVIIDREYSGKEGIIKGMLLGYIHQVDSDFPKEKIMFGPIKKEAHEKAYSTFTGNQGPDRKVTAEELIALLDK